jgi:DNA-binding CsgD family transcriptional regulator
MSLSLEWSVLLLFVSILLVLLVVFEINSKFRWKRIANDLDNENIQLRAKIAQSPTFKIELKEILDEIRSNLTFRQFQIFIYTIEGFSSKEIADKLFLSARTVDSHIKEILAKLEVEKRSQLSGIFFDGLKNKIKSDSIIDL